MELQIRRTTSPTTENDVIVGIGFFHVTFLIKIQWGDKAQLCENSVLKAKPNKMAQMHLSYLFWSKDIMYEETNTPS